MGEAALPVKHKGLLTLGVMGATIIQILDSTIANVAIPHMQASLGATQESVTWVLTSYIIASAIAIPITGWLSDRFGSRRLFLIAVTGFIATSMMCGVAVTLTQMVIFRLLQGVCSAFIGPLSQTVLLDINPPENAPRAMAIWGMGIMIAPIMGPIIGGWLTESYNWRWVFYINLPIGVATLALLWWLLPSRQILRRSFDAVGFSMLAIGLASFQLMLDRGAQSDWFNSWEICIEAALTISAIWIFFTHQMTSKQPMFSRSFVKDRNFLTALLFMTVVGLMMMGVFALLPPLLQRIYGYSVIDTGILLAPRGLGILVAMFIAARLNGKVDLRYFIALGFITIAYSFWSMTHWSLSMGWQPVVFTGIIQGIGMGFVFIPLNGLAFATLPANLRTDGSSLLYLFRSLGGSVGISALTTILSANIQISHEDLAGHVTAYSLSSVDPSSADRLGTIGAATLSMLNAEISRQATMIAYLDNFKMLMVTMLVCVPLVILLRPAQAPQPRK